MSHQSSSHSLFPAYSSQSSLQKETSEEKGPQGWLTNNSFTPEALKEVQENEILIAKVINDVQDEPGTKRQKCVSASQDSCSRKIFKKSPALPRPEVQKDSQFYVHKKYDAENYSLGSLDFKTIPKHVTRSCPPLGSAAKDVHLYFPSKTKKKSKRLCRYFSKLAIRQANSIPKKIDTCRKDSVPLSDFLSFNQRRSDESTDGNAFTPIGLEGCSVTWKSYFNKSSNAKSTNEDEESEVLSVSEAELIERITNFNRAVTATPRDEQLWLDFVKFQRELLLSSTFSKKGFFSESAMCDKQISILDKALKHNPNSVRLTVAKLRILKILQDKKEHLSLWESLIFYHPNNIVAWHHYLAFVLSDISYFDVPKISKLFQKCLKTLSNILQGNMQSHPPPPSLMQDTIKIFSAICRIVYGFGQRELALGLFQAQIEFNMFAPPSVLQIESCSERVDLFEPFWDSGAPRIGEPNAIGWHRTVSERIIAKNPEASVLGLNDHEDDILRQNLSEWETWLAFETLRESNNWLPWRPDPNLDQESDQLDDPEREVTFEQISKYLFEIKEEEDKFLLVCEFFRFLGVSLHNMDCSFLQSNENSLSIDETFYKIYTIVKDIFPDKKVPESLFLDKVTHADCHAGFVSNVYMQSLKALPEKFRKLLSFVWVRHKINRAFTKIGIESYDKSVVSNLKKEIKSLLKQQENRNCLFLWSEYIRLVWLTEDYDDANQMFEKILITTMNSDILDNNISVERWHFVSSYVELYLGLKNSKISTCEEAFDVLLWSLSHIGRNVKYTPFVKEQKISNAMLMKSCACFKTLLDQEMSHLNVEEKFFCCCLNPCEIPFLSFLSCAIYFQYLFKGLESAMDLCQDTLRSLKDKAGAELLAPIKYIEERIIILQADIQQFHARRGISSVSHLEGFFCKTVEKYPGNVYLLGLLVQCRSAAPVIGPVRRFFYQLLKKQDVLPPVTWLFAIISELLICLSVSNAMTVSPVSELSVEKAPESYQINNCGVTWKIRSLFERAVNQADLRNSVALWRTYLKFEITIGETQKAKAVFHQALQNCPWAKALYLDGIKYFPEDLRYLLETITEKQVRVHTLLEEVELLMNFSHPKN